MKLQLADQLTLGAIAWSWQHPHNGSLATVFYPDGSVTEVRLHRKEVQASVCKVGQIGPQRWAALRSASELVCQKGLRDVAQDSSAADEYFTALRITDRGQCEERTTPASELEQNTLLAEFRREVLAARDDAEGGRFRWRSLAGRLFWLCIPLAMALLFCWWIDSVSSVRLQREGQQEIATVVQRVGHDSYDEQKALVVQFANRNNTIVKATIKEYLSAVQWEQGVPGHTIAILNHSQLGTFVAEDIARFERTKAYFLLLPLGLLVLALVALLLFPRMRIGCHADGQEYVVMGDRVVSDDKDMPVSRLTISIGRLLWRVLK